MDKVIHGGLGVDVHPRALGSCLINQIQRRAIGSSDLCENRPFIDDLENKLTVPECLFTSGTKRAFRVWSRRDGWTLAWIEDDDEDNVGKHPPNIM